MSDTILCVDLGGTKALVAQVDEQGIKEKHYFDVDSHLTKQQMNQFLYRIIDYIYYSYAKQHFEFYTNQKHHHLLKGSVSKCMP